MVQGYVSIHRRPRAVEESLIVRGLSRRIRKGVACIREHEPARS